MSTRTYPWRWYADPEVLRRERELIFRRAWHYVGRVAEVAEAGSFMACSAGDIPVVAVRDRAGVLRAFLNVCRHRGCVVATGSGRRQTLQCPYHAWTYGLDGSLVAAPRAEREGGLEAGELGLVPLALDTVGAFLFVGFEPELPLGEALGESAPLLEAASDLVFDRRLDYELAANWKLACENYLECYHCPVAHPGFSELVDVSRDAYRLRASGSVASQYGPARRGGPAGRFHFVWPNLKVNVFPGPPNLSIGPLWPVDAERTAGFLDYFFAPEPDPAWLRDFFELDDAVGREDAALVESVQRGVRAGVLERGRLLPESEQLVGWFQARVAEALTRRDGA